MSAAEEAKVGNKGSLKTGFILGLLRGLIIKNGWNHRINKWTLEIMAKTLNSAYLLMKTLQSGASSSRVGFG